jgi:hypothetical protein
MAQGESEEERKEAALNSAPILQFFQIESKRRLIFIAFHKTRMIWCDAMPYMQ